MLHPFHPGIVQIGEFRRLRKILANQAVGVLVQPALPGTIPRNDTAWHRNCPPTSPRQPPGARKSPCRCPPSRCTPAPTAASSTPGPLPRPQTTSCSAPAEETRASSNGSPPITSAPRWREPTIVSNSQSPTRRLNSTTAVRSAMSTRHGITARPALRRPRRLAFLPRRRRCRCSVLRAARMVRPAR